MSATIMKFELKQTSQSTITNYLLKQQSLKAMHLLFVSKTPYDDVKLPKLLKGTVKAESCAW